jgi:RNase adaptor protein for sRNA GlmZ degradation
MEAGELPVPLPELWEALRGLVRSARLRSLTSSPSLPLTVRVESFSFKKGYPVDNSGHGGGFVFDCRALPNPGREQRFARSSGLDPEVVSWLQAYDEVAAFLSQAKSLLLPTLDAYQKRGFTHLSVSFGCTGGQHRSVYCAEALARWLRSREGITVDLQHREAPNWPRG